ncbi:ABC transporter ATP-binding protein [Hamadaea tsunoensis]|uniref:ABC transporter ATP-binding protein n=1 Tax=Hamadaea tsunoensis TaxID=53368 RepID=UPI0003F7073C|nr:ABC transporter ATP-binding protein [Hamadaea tsunoensis]
MAREILPIAPGSLVRAYAGGLLKLHRRALGKVVALHGLAAVAGLVAPRLLGDLIDTVTSGGRTGHVDRLALGIVASVVAHSVIIRFAVYASSRFGEQMLADVREEFVGRVLNVPLSTVEKAGTGDLMTRASRDVGSLNHSVRNGVPELFVAAVTAVLSAIALVLNSPLLALPCLAGAPLLIWISRWYLGRATPGYLRENAAYADVTDSLAETVEGARTSEAFGYAERRNADIRARIGGSYAAERFTLGLRTVLFPVIDMGFTISVTATLILGGVFYFQGWATLGQMVAATVYVQQMVRPIERMLEWLDELQVGMAALARLVGVGLAADESGDPSLRPRGAELVASGVEYAYVPGRPVLHGIDLTLRPGERLAMVGPSGAGKSTLGRLLAGIHPPTAGSVTVGGVDMARLPLDRRRSEVALVTQEHHVFLGTLRDNLLLAKPDATDDELWHALASVDLRDWVEELADGLDTRVGSGGFAVPPAQAQQLALARLVLADPHTLVLDEATSLIDPRAARHLERSLAAVLAGRTVVAIAHRLFSAHDADRVAVVEDGRIAELGSHDELVAAGGSYAALWRSWQA